MTIGMKRGIMAVLAGSWLFYNFFVYTSGTFETYEMPDDARAGKMVFQKYNCIACHQIYGLGGHMGPDLTNTVKEKGDLYARSFIMSGTQKMPKFEMTEKEMNDLVSYLSYVSATSDYPQNNYKLTWYGTVEYQKEHEQDQ